MILRHHDGTVIFTAYIYVFHCNDALEVEIHAMIQGMALAMQHTELPVILQSDSSTTLPIFRNESLVRSPCAHFVVEIKALREAREFIPQELHHSQNRVADCLARYRRTLLCGYIEGPRVLMYSFLLTVTL